MKLRFLLVSCAAIIVAWSAAAQSFLLPETKKKEDVSEVAFRHFMAEAKRTYPWHVFCISSAVSLRPEFIDRFAGSSSRVVWECDSNGWGGFSYGKDKIPAVLVKICSIRWVSDWEAKVKGALYHGDSDNPQYSIRVVQRNNHWIVKSKVPESSDWQLPKREN
jgi:hypothetical protein